MGFWLKNDTPTQAYVTRDRFGQFELFVAGIDKSLYIGQSKDSGTVFLGRDSDGSGLSDVTLVNSNRERMWSWILSFDPVGKTPSNKRILFGQKNEIVFLFRNRGKTDSLAVLRVRNNRGEIQYRGLRSKFIRKIRLKRFPVSKLRPIVFKSHTDGRDSLAFQINANQGDSLVIVNHGGTVTRSILIPPGFVPLVGDYNSNGIEEIIFASSTRIIIPDIREVPVLIQGAIPLDAGRARDYEGSDVSATIVPTTVSTVGATHTNTVPPILTPTVTSQITVSVTSSPTVPSSSTPTVTGTPTISPTPDTIAPTGFSVSFDQSQINAANQYAVSFTISGGESGATYTYSIDDTDSGTSSISGDGLVTGSSLVISGINVASLRDGMLTLALILKDSSNNASLPKVSLRPKDASAPTITNALATDGAYPVGSYLPIALQISESVVVSGTPRIALDVGGVFREATYHADSSTGTFLVFRYQVQTSDSDPDGITIASPNVNLSGGSITDSFGNGISTLFSIPNTSTVFTYNIAANCNALRAAGFTTDGVYQIDPDGSGAGLSPFNAYCDMATDGGGWTLVGNYLWASYTAAVPIVRTNNLPIQNGTSLGSHGSLLSGGIYWGNASNSLLNALAFSEIRLFCKTSAHSRVVHFKTNLPSAISYVKTGVGSYADIQYTFTPLAGHTALLPGAADSVIATLNGGDFAILQGIGNGPLLTYVFIAGFGNGRRCDDVNWDEFNTHHQAWIR